MQTGEETAAAEEPILEEGSGREQVREGRSTRLFGVSSLCFCTKTVRGLDSGTLQLPNSTSRSRLLLVQWQNMRLTLFSLEGVTFSPRSLMPGAGARTPSRGFDVNGEQGCAVFR